MSDIQFARGQQVRVNHVAVSIVNGEVTGRVLQPEFIGTIVGYWRNGYYIVREPEHGTTKAYPFMELSHVGADEVYDPATGEPYPYGRCDQCGQPSPCSKHDQQPLPARRGKAVTSTVRES